METAKIKQINVKVVETGSTYTKIGITKIIEDVDGSLYKSDEEQIRLGKNDEIELALKKLDEPKLQRIYKYEE